MKRIFLGPIEVAGYYHNLAKGFKEIGIPCDHICYSDHKYDYEQNEVDGLIIPLIKRLNQNENKKYFQKIISSICVELLGAIFLLKVICKYDVFIFGFGSSLLPRTNLDLLLLKKLNKKVIFLLAHGAEARPPYLDGAHKSADGKSEPSLKKLRAMTRRKKRKLDFISKNSDILVGAPLNSHFLMRKMVNIMALGLPFSDQNLKYLKKNSENLKENSDFQGVRILHAPSHPYVKGTFEIKRVISLLQDAGHSIELVLLKGLPNGKVLQELERCDFVVDQIYSDGPLGGLGVEAAWFGKPTVVGGYGINKLQSITPAEMWPPSQICCPGDLKGAILHLIENKKCRLQLGEDAKTFVLKNWSSRAVALNYTRLIEDKIPETWFFNPKSVCYLDGAGQSKSETSLLVSRLINTYGIGSLCLSHRKDLEESFLALVNKKLTK